MQIVKGIDYKVSLSQTENYGLESVRSLPVNGLSTS